MSQPGLPVPTNSPGFTVCAYNADGSQLLVGGLDSYIRIYETEIEVRNLAPGILDKHSEAVSVITTCKTGAASGGFDGMVLLYNTKNEFEKILVRSVVPIRDIVFHPSGNKLAIASDENDIRIVLTADNSKVVSLKGHTYTVKSISYDRSGDYLLSSACNGEVRIWNVSNDVPAPTCIKIFSNIMRPTLPDSISKGSVRWNPDGKSFATIGNSMDIRVFSKGLWNTFYTLEGGHKEHINMFQWSPNGYYLASAGADKQLVIWDTQSKSVINKCTCPEIVTAISWHPIHNQLAVADNGGDMFYWDEVVPNESRFPHPALMQLLDDEPHHMSQIMAEGDEDDGYTQNSFHPSDTHHRSEVLSDVDLGEDIEMMDELDEIDDFVIDDDGAGYAETGEQATLKLQQQLKMGAHPKHRLAEIEPPSSFQPGETPYHSPEDNASFDPANGERRYLVHNLVGAVYTIYQDGHSIINVDFHDQGENRNFHFTDDHNFTLAAMSDKGTVFAVETKKSGVVSKLALAVEEGLPEEEKNEPSVLYFRPLNVWGTMKEWTLYMPHGEDITNVAINSYSIIASTSKGYIRIFTLSGVQKHLFSLDNVVTMTAKSDLCLIVYAVSPGFSHQQYLKYVLMNTEMNEILQKDELQISKHNEISWVGFTETSQAAVYDSDYVLRVLHSQRRPNQAVWVPVFDGKTYARSVDREERYWPVGVLSDRMMCIILRGSHLYPFFPRPPVSTVPLSLPLVQINTDVGKLEEEYLRTSVKYAHERDEAEAADEMEAFEDEFLKDEVGMDKALLKLIQIACKFENVVRALDITYILHNARSVDAAIKIASFHHLTKLAEKMMTVKEEKFDNNNPKYKTKNLSELRESQPRLFESNVSAMSSDLAFLDKPNQQAHFYKRQHYQDDDSSMMLSSDLSSPDPKRLKPFSFTQSSYDE